MARSNTGFCRLCGNYGKLTFEHIPPKAAFNNHQQLLTTMGDYFGSLYTLIIRLDRLAADFGDDL